MPINLKKKLFILFSTLIAGVLAGCGDNKLVEMPAAQEIPVTVQFRTIILDVNIPANLTSKIASTISPVDSSVGVAEKLLFPKPNDGTPGESMVLAVDADHNILLAAMTTAEGLNIDLNAESTALALTRLALGRLSDQINPSNVNAAIKATAQWPDLVLKVRASLAVGQSPARDHAVYDSLLALLPQAGMIVSTRPTTQQQSTAIGRRTAQAARVANPSLIPSAMPQRIVSGISSKLGVFAKGTSGAGLEVSNAMSIIWSVGTRDTDNRALCPAGVGQTTTNPDCILLLDRMDTLKQLAYLTDLNLAAPPSVVTGGNNHAFNLLVRQDGLARTANLQSVVKDVTMLVIDGMSAGKAKPIVSDCAKNIADILLPPTELTALISASNSQPVKQYFNDLVSTSAGSIKLVSTLSSCMTFKEVMAEKSRQAALAIGTGVIGDNAIQNAVNSVDFSASTVLASVWTFVKDLGFYAAGQLGPVTAVINSGGLGVTIGQIIDNWTTERTIGVCLVNGAVASCANTLDFNPHALIATLGSALPEQSALSALDIAGNLTLLPGDIVYSSSQPSVLAVDPATGALTLGSLTAGSKTSTVTIAATVASTGVTSSYSVVVSEQPPAAFTKVSAAGDDLPADATEWACVRQNANGLMWEAHVRRGLDATGNWIMHSCAWDRAVSGCTGISMVGDGNEWDASSIPGTVSRKCGRGGWRLPTLLEGQALFNDRAYIAEVPSTGAFHRAWFGTDDIATSSWASTPISPANPADFPIAWAIDYERATLPIFGVWSGYVGNVRLVATPP
ncbi:MAG: hypothetical protein RIQ60_2822 [Pseudomonadota bacterium]